MFPRHFIAFFLFELTFQFSQPLICNISPQPHRMKCLKTAQSATSNTENFTSQTRKTFKRFMQVELWRSPELEDLFPILCNIENACRDVNRLMRRVSTDNLQGYNVGVFNSGISIASVNIQGEDQKKLDVSLSKNVDLRTL